MTREIAPREYAVRAQPNGEIYACKSLADGLLL